MFTGMWSEFELFFTTGLPSYILYPSLTLTFVAIIVGTCFDVIKIRKSFVLWILLAEYLFVVVSSTVIFRSQITNARWELMPFWTYVAVLEHIKGVSVWDIVLNVALFMPLGFLLKLLHPRISFWKMLLIGMICSFCIEVLQNIFSKGISQFDDIMHNTVGCALGWLLAKSIILYNKSEK